MKNETLRSLYRCFPRCSQLGWWSAGSAPVFAFAVILLIGVMLHGHTAAQEKAEKEKPRSQTEQKTSKDHVVRTLEAINIEGAIAVPQVLFITSRAYPRYRDGLDAKLRVTALEVARSFDLPTRIRIIALHEKNKEEGP